MDSDKGRNPSDAFEGITKPIFEKREGNVFGWKLSFAAAAIIGLMIAFIYYNHTTGKINFRTGQPFDWVDPDSLAAWRADSLRRDSIIKHHEALLQKDTIQIDTSAQ